ncbi:UbiH/UbiF/VisC/COQ6 family ubiquinone biosynthesis hydroxylase [Pistricoccus aurantiacus]|uniref:UbiH/UbiF/VisC/COQ6 family ubiquinone biosynthesis hydroxylase n=1 Tax=Pistricoccus aurantiacus TaxID=1883414 RepID=UPI003624B17F
MQDAVNQAEVLIVGGGIVGLGLAALLGEAGVEVSLIDAGPAPASTDLKSTAAQRPDLRVSALNPISQRLLQTLGAWSCMETQRVTPYYAMQVWDSQGSGEIHFSADQAGVPVLGHIVENIVTQQALAARLEQLPTVTTHYSAKVVALEEAPRGRRLRLENGEQLDAPLVVAADGARSPLRDLAGIDVDSRDTGHAALVTTVRVARGHGGVARQVFLSGGPLAFLPVDVAGRDDHCSIVWSTSPADAERLASLTPTALAGELEQAFEVRLGAVEVVDRAVSLPLVQRHAKEYVRDGFALIGDAAHSIHPLAGQGVNLGLMDAAVLAEELLSARTRGARLGDPRILNRYARRRRGDNAGMLALMDGFRLLFGSTHPALVLARNLGLGGVDRLTPLKRLLMHQAIGERGRLPASCS